MLFAAFIGGMGNQCEEVIDLIRKFGKFFPVCCDERK